MTDLFDSMMDLTGVTESTRLTSAWWYERLAVKCICNPNGWQKEPNPAYFWFNVEITWEDFSNRLANSSITMKFTPLYPYGPINNISL